MIVDKLPKLKAFKAWVMLSDVFQIENLLSSDPFLGGHHLLDSWRGWC